jgi:kynurenine formamidase
LSLWASVQGARVFDLAQPYFVGMPHHPSHPPYLFGLTKKHGDMLTPAGNSSAADAIALGSHVGTHIDGFGHFSCGGLLHGGLTASDRQSYSTGLSVHTADGIAPLVRRGVLLDFAPHGPLDESVEITPAMLEGCGVAIREGDVVLLRTGWAQYWRDAGRYINAMGGAPKGPGPGLAGAKWLSERRPVAVGSDTVAFEKVPAPDMPVHVHLLVECGIHLIEALNLEELAAAGAREFLFIAAPLKLEGATGAPLRPIALL